MKDGIYKISIVVTEVRTAIPISTEGKWLTMAANWTGDGVASASPLLRNASASASDAVSASEANIASPIGMFSNVTGAVQSLAPVEMTSKAVVEEIRSSAVTRVSAKIEEVKSVDTEKASSTALAAGNSTQPDIYGKYFNGTSNSTEFNETVHL